MQLPRRSVRSIQELPSIYTAFPVHYKPVRTHSASTASTNSATSPDIEDGLEVVPLEYDSIRSAPIVTAYLDEKEVLISTQELCEKPLPSIPTSLWARTWGRMSVKYRVLSVLGLQAVVLLTIGMILFTVSAKPPEYGTLLPVAMQANVYPSEPSKAHTTGGNTTNTSSITIERGTFSVPVLVPQQQSSACLARANESRAWQCAFDTVLQLSILPSLGDHEPAMVTLGLPSTYNRSVHCGQQAPEIGPTALTTVNDPDEGSQYRFSAIYDRTVILRDNQLGQQSVSTSPMVGQPKHRTFSTGQALWRCTFNDTRLEGIIYADQKGGAAETNTSSGVKSPLPYKLKLVEHTAASESTPYCERVVVGVDGALKETGESVELELSGAQSDSTTSQRDADTSCQCQWVVG